jgi:hypothetical protein
MTATITPPKPTFPSTMSFSTALGKNVTFERLDGANGGPIGTVNDIKVFKAGTFRDSMGRQHTWSSEHLQQMVFHFNLLRANQMLPNVPVREDHWSGAQGVLGYFESMRSDGEFLYANLGITEPTGADKIERGTYRGRSLEVGMFEANDESMYWPVVLGVAFVDIPAVEGLYDKGPDNKNVSYFIISEALMSGTAPATFSKEHVDFAIACAYAQGLQDAPADKAPAMFKINGADTSDVAAIQNHIVALEKFQVETGEAHRKSYVTQLAADGKILATQVDALAGLAVTMSDTQFEAFKKGYDDAPKNPAFAMHNSNGNAGGSKPEDAVKEEIAVLEETVATHRRSGMAPEVLEKTASYVRLQALKSKTA